jgi:hypothetical protein
MDCQRNSDTLDTARPTRYLGLTAGMPWALPVVHHVSNYHRAPLCVAYGMGVDSTAMLVGMWRRGIRPDLITFADTGGEKPETYEYLATINEWLRGVGFPDVTVVRYAGRHSRYSTLEGNCLANETLPSLAFGGKGCSLKFKAAVQNAYRARWAPAIAAWGAGQRVTVCIGYDAGPTDGRRSTLAETPKYAYRYLLREWGWDRDRCKAEIVSAGLPLPMKSACWFCPASQPSEIAWLVERHPGLADRIIAMEAAAAPNLRSIQGLWRNGVKGTRGGIAKPGSMTVYIRERRALRIVEN